MDRSQLLLLGLPIFLFVSDIFNLFATTPPPPKPRHHHLHNHKHVNQFQFNPNPNPNPNLQHQQSQLLQFPAQKSSNIIGGGGIGIGTGSTVSIDFCASCSYRGTAMNMKNMLETQFPGIDIILANYPPSLPKRVLSKIVPVVQFGMIGLITAGEHIFPRLGFAVPPPWYYSLRANKFGSIASTWLFGNFIQSFLQSSGAFEVYCNGELVFSKLAENRFPGEIELRDLVGRTLATSRIVDGGEGAWP